MWQTKNNFSQTLIQRYALEQHLKHCAIEMTAITIITGFQGYTSAYTFLTMYLVFTHTSAGGVYVPCIYSHARWELP